MEMFYIKDENTNTVLSKNYFIDNEEDSSTLLYDIVFESFTDETCFLLFPTEQEANSFISMNLNNKPYYRPKKIIFEE